MTRAEMGLKLNKLGMMLPDTTLIRAGKTLREIIDGVAHLYEKIELYEKVVEDLEDNIDLRTMSVAQAEGYCRALEDIKKVVGK